MGPDQGGGVNEETTDTSAAEAETELDSEDLLVEEVSIDGLCGVY